MVQSAAPRSALQAGFSTAREVAQIFTRHAAQLALFREIDGGLGRLDLARGAGLDFDEAEHVAVPAHQVNLARPPARAVIARHDHVPHLAQIEVRLLLSAPPGLEMLRLLWRP